MSQDKSIRKYTNKYHAHRLTLLLKHCQRYHPKAAEGICPADYFKAQYPPGSDCVKEMEWSNDQCKVCRSFIGMTDKDVKDLSKGWHNKSITIGKCPCIVFGYEKAIRLTVEALKEYYDED